MKVDLVPSQFHITDVWFLHPGQKLAKPRPPTQELLMECPNTGEISAVKYAKGSTLWLQSCGRPHLVLHQQRALGRVWEMGSSPLHHQLKGGVWLNTGQILFPQNAARAALNAKELQEKQILTHDRKKLKNQFNPHKLEQSKPAVCARTCACTKGLLPRAPMLTLPEAVTITIIFCRLNSSLANVSMLISFLIWLRGFRAS